MEKRKDIEKKKRRKREKEGRTFEQVD